MGERKQTQANSPSLRQIADAYHCFRNADAEDVTAEHGVYRTYCSAVGRFLAALRECSDDYWTPFVRHIQRFKYDAASAPVSFRAIGHLCSDRHASIVARYLNCDRLYPALAVAAHDLLNQVASLSALDDAPLLRRVQSIAEQHRSLDAALVLCDTRLIPLVTYEFAEIQTLRDLRILSAMQLRSPRCYERLYVIGSGRAFPEHVLAAPRARSISAIHYRWMPGHRREASLFPSPRPNGPMMHASDALSSETDISTSDDGESAEWQWFAGTGLSDLAAKYSLHSFVEHHEAIRALPVALEGGNAVFLDAEDGATTLVIDLEERDKRIVRRVATSEIEEGMFVLLRAGGGGDLIVPVADALLKDRAAEVRRIQAEWKGRLRDKVREMGLFALSVALLDHGALRANEPNVRRWAWERSIRPGDLADFRAILHLVGLEKETESYWDAMRQIDRAHAQAGQRIRRLLLDRVRSSNLGDLERLGVMEFELPGTHDARMLAARVLKVADQVLSLHPSEVGRIFEAD